MVEGRVFSLSVRDAGSRVRLGPAWAVLCGAVAAGGLALDWRSLVSLLLAVMMADAVLGSVWGLASGGRRPWLRKAIGKRGRQARGSGVRGFLEYVRGRPGHWRSQVWARAGTTVLGLWFLVLLALALAAALSGAVLLLTVAALAVAVWRQALISREGALSAVLESCYLAGLPWLIGWFAFAGLGLARSELVLLTEALVWSAGYALTFHACRLLGGQRLTTGANLLVMAQVVAAALLILVRQPLLAGGVALLLLPQVMLQPAMLDIGEGVWYLQRVQVFTMLAMLAAAVALVG